MLLKNSQNGTSLASMIVFGKFKNCINCFSVVYSKIKRNLSVPSTNFLTPPFPQEYSGMVALFTCLFSPVLVNWHRKMWKLMDSLYQSSLIEVVLQVFTNLCAKMKIRVTFPSKVKMPFFRVHMNQNAWCLIDHKFTWLLSRWTWLFMYPLKDRFNYFNPKRYRIVWYICIMFLYKVFDP